MSRVRGRRGRRGHGLYHVLAVSSPPGLSAGRPAGVCPGPAATSRRLRKRRRPAAQARHLHWSFGLPCGVAFAAAGAMAGVCLLLCVPRAPQRTRPAMTRGAWPDGARRPARARCQSKTRPLGVRLKGCFPPGRTARAGDHGSSSRPGAARRLVGAPCWLRGTDSSDAARDRAIQTQRAQGSRRRTEAAAATGPAHADGFSSRCEGAQRGASQPALAAASRPTYTGRRRLAVQSGAWTLKIGWSLARDATRDDLGAPPASGTMGARELSNERRGHVSNKHKPRQRAAPSQRQASIQGRVH